MTPILRNAELIRKLLQEPISKVLRPTNSYLLFHHEQGPLLTKENPNLSRNEKFKKTSDLWHHELSNEQKDVYVKRAEADKERYDREVAIET